MARNLDQVDITAPATAEEVIFSCLADPDVRWSVMPNDEQFAVVLDARPSEEHDTLRLHRFTGRQILQDNGIEPIAMGAERLVLGVLQADEVHKYALASEDPERDAIVEQHDYDVCCRYMGSAVVETAVEIVNVGGRVVLRERQPWLELAPEQTITRPHAQLDDAIDALMDRAAAIPRHHGLIIDPTSIMCDQTYRPVIVDTSLLLPPEAYIADLPRTPGVASKSRCDRSWRSLGLNAA